jgi:hypothetical protein
MLVYWRASQRRPEVVGSSHNATPEAAALCWRLGVPAADLRRGPELAEALLVASRSGRPGDMPHRAALCALLARRGWRGPWLVRGRDLRRLAALSPAFLRALGAEAEGLAERPGTPEWWAEVAALAREWRRLQPAREALCAAGVPASAWLAVWREGVLRRLVGRLADRPEAVAPLRSPVPYGEAVEALVGGLPATYQRIVRNAGGGHETLVWDVGASQRALEGVLRSVSSDRTAWRAVLAPLSWTADSPMTRTRWGRQLAEALAYALLPSPHVATGAVWAPSWAPTSDLGAFAAAVRESAVAPAPRAPRGSAPWGRTLDMRDGDAPPVAARACMWPARLDLAERPLAPLPVRACRWAARLDLRAGFARAPVYTAPRLFARLEFA